MAGQVETQNMALFCDFENIALGVRDAKYAKFDIQKVLVRLLPGLSVDCWKTASAAACWNLNGTSAPAAISSICRSTMTDADNTGGSAAIFGKRIHG